MLFRCFLCSHHHTVFTMSPYRARSCCVYVCVRECSRTRAAIEGAHGRAPVWSCLDSSTMTLPLLLLLLLLLLPMIIIIVITVMIDFVDIFAVHLQHAPRPRFHPLVTSTRTGPPHSDCFRPTACECSSSSFRKPPLHQQSRVRRSHRGSSRELAHGLDRSRLL